jgi:hypothetical protein
LPKQNRLDLFHFFAGTVPIIIGTFRVRVRFLDFSLNRAANIAEKLSKNK